MIHYDDRGGNYDFNSKSCNLFSTIRFFSFFFFFFFQHGVEIVSPPSSSPFFLRFDFIRSPRGFRFDSRDFNAIFLPISCYDDSTLTFNPTLVSSKNPINRRGKREGKKKKSTIKVKVRYKGRKRWKKHWRIATYTRDPVSNVNNSANDFASIILASGWKALEGRWSVTSCTDCIPNRLLSPALCAPSY